MSTSQNDTPPAAPARGRLERSSSDRIVAGVCGGLGAYFDVDPVIFRIAFVVLAFVGGAAFLLYPAAWLLLPEEGHHRSIGESWVQRGRTGHVLPIVLIVIGALILSGDLLSRHHGGGIGFAVVAIVIGLLLLRRRPSLSTQQSASTEPPASPPFPWSPPPPAPPAPDSDDTVVDTTAVDTTAVDTTAVDAASTEPAAALPPPPDTPPPAPPGGGGGASWGPSAEELQPPKGRSLTGIVLSVLLIGAGAVGLLHAAGALDVSVQVFLAGAVIFVGVALIVSAWTGGSAGLIAVGVVLTVALAIATVVHAPLSGGIGDRRWVPSSPEEVRTYYKHGGGDVVLDLSHVAFPSEGQSVRVRLGVGHLRIVVPQQGRATVTAHAGAGDIFLFGRHENGVDVDSTAATGDAADGLVRLNVNVGAGQIEVVRAADVFTPPEPVSPPEPISPPKTAALR